MITKKEARKLFEKYAFYKGESALLVLDKEAFEQILDKIYGKESDKVKRVFQDENRFD